MNASLTRDAKEVTILTSTRMFMANIGGFAVTGGIPLVVALFAPKDPNTGAAILGTTEAAGAWFITMLIYALVGFFFLWLCFVTTKERVVMDKKDSANVKVSDLWIGFIKNKPLRVLACFFLVGFSVYSISNAAGSYYMTYNMSATADQISIYMALGFLPGLIFLPLLPVIKDKIGKKGVVYLFLAIGLVGLAILYVTSSFEELKSQM